MAVGHLTIRRYKINIRPENFRPMIFQLFGEAADLIVGQMLCPPFQHRQKSCFGRTIITLLFIYRFKQIPIPVLPERGMSQLSNIGLNTQMVLLQLLKYGPRFGTYLSHCVFCSEVCNSLKYNDFFLNSLLIISRRFLVF